MKRTFWVMIGIIVTIVVSCAVSQNSASSKFKNLKVLPKDISEERLDTIMHHFTASLNVKCNFCHVRTEDGKAWDYPSDKNKHKNIAREMIELTTEINKDYFNLTGEKISYSTTLVVTCYTCHNGNKEPKHLPVATKP